MKTLLTLALLLITSTADACIFGRCRRCVQQRQVSYYQAPQQAAETPVVSNQTIILSTTYPQPLIQPGTSAFGYASNGSSDFVAQFVPLDPNLAMNLQARIATYAAETLQDTVSRGLSVTSGFTSIVKLQLAIEQLRALGLNDEQTTTTTTTTIQNGLVLDKCAECHGSGIAEPKGDLRFGPDVELSFADIGRAINQVRLDKMPKDNPLSDVDKARLLNELFQRVVE